MFDFEKAMKQWYNEQDLCITRRLTLNEDVIIPTQKYLCTLIDTLKDIYVETNICIFDKLYPADYRYLLNVADNLGMSIDVHETLCPRCRNVTCPIMKIRHLMEKLKLDFGMFDYKEEEKDEG